MQVDMTSKTRDGKRPKYQVLKRSLLNMIGSGEFEGGQKLPSESELQKKYEVSNTTARRCLDELAGEGYVYRVQGKGTFVSHLAHICGKQSLGVLCTGLASMTHPFMKVVFSGIEEYLDEEKFLVELLPETLFSNAAEPSKALVHLIEQRNLKGLFVMSPMPSGWLMPLCEKKYPLVSIGIDFQDLPVIKVLPDSEGMLAKSLEYLINSGHKRICVFAGRFRNQPERTVDSYTHFLKVINGYAEQYLDEDLKIEIVDYDWFNSTEIYSKLFSRIKAPDRPTAIVLVEDSLVQMLWDIALKSGLRIPADVSVVLNSSGSINSFNRITTMYCNVENIIWRASRVMEQLLEGEKPVRTTEIIKGSLHISVSTQVCRKYTDHD